jgi:tRNA G18 (ribose-2'-O)-methylase SpoU
MRNLGMKGYKIQTLGFSKPRNVGSCVRTGVAWNATPAILRLRSAPPLLQALGHSLIGTSMSFFMSSQ